MVAYRFVVSLSLALVASAAAAAQKDIELFDFYLPTCGPCQAMAPTVAALEAEGVRVRRIDGSREPQLVARLGVDRYPTFVAMIDGREVGRAVGMTDLDALRALVSSAPRGTGSLQPTAGRGEVFAVGSDRGAGRAAPPTAAPREHAALLGRSVRLTINDKGSVSYGTGTVIDARSGEALVVTCAHLFLDDRREPIDSEGKLSIELFDAATGVVRVAERVEGQLITHDAEADVALVAIRPRGVVATARVAPSANALRVGDRVRSVGCDLGADATVREHAVVDLDRYQGPPNVEASGAPTQGRSGGGLFDAQGQLVGVCNFADDAADEGIYAGVASIHALLDRVGLSDLYRGTPPAASGGFAAAPAAASAAPAGLTPIERSPVVRGQNAGFADAPLDAAPAAPLTAPEQAALTEIARRGERADVTVVIHSEGGGSEVLTLDAASPEFVAALRRLSTTR